MGENLETTIMGLYRDSYKGPALHSWLSKGQSRVEGFSVIKVWVLPPFSNSWIIIIAGLFIALNRTPNIECYWVGAVPKIKWLKPVR